MGSSITLLKKEFKEDLADLSDLCNPHHLFALWIDQSYYRQTNPELLKSIARVHHRIRRPPG